MKNIWRTTYAQKSKELYENSYSYNISIYVYINSICRAKIYHPEGFKKLASNGKERLAHIIEPKRKFSPKIPFNQPKSTIFKWGTATNSSQIGKKVNPTKEQLEKTSWDEKTIVPQSAKWQK